MDVHPLMWLRLSFRRPVTTHTHTHTPTLYLECALIAMATLAYWLMGRLYPTADVGLFFICEDLLN